MEYTLLNKNNPVIDFTYNKTGRMVTSVGEIYTICLQMEKSPVNTMSEVAARAKEIEEERDTLYEKHNAPFTLVIEPSLNKNIFEMASGA